MFFRDELLSWSWRRPLGMPLASLAGGGSLNPIDFKHKVTNNVEHVIGRINGISPQFYSEEVSDRLMFSLFYAGKHLIASHSMNSTQQLITILDSKYVDNRFDSLRMHCDSWAIYLCWSHWKLELVSILCSAPAMVFLIRCSTPSVKMFLYSCVSGRECNGPSTVSTEGRHGIGGGSIGTSELVHDGPDMASVVLTCEIDRLGLLMTSFQEWLGDSSVCACICIYGVIFTGISNLQIN